MSSMTSEEKISDEKIRDALQSCFDPEIPVNIVDLGLIYGIDTKEQGSVKIRMTLTALGCPLSSFLENDIKRKVMSVPGVRDVDVEVVWDPPWSPEKMSKDARQALGI